MKPTEEKRFSKPTKLVIKVLDEVYAGKVYSTKQIVYAYIVLTR